MAYKANVEKGRGDATPNPLAAKGARDQLAATLEQIRQRLDAAIGTDKPDDRRNEPGAAAPTSTDGCSPNG